MPDQSANRADGFLNPADGLSFSGAVVVQNEVNQPGDQLKELLPQLAATFGDTSTSASSYAPATRATNDDSAEPRSSQGSLTPSEPFDAANSDDEKEDEDEESREAEDEDSEDKPLAEKDESVANALAESNCDTSHSDKYCVYTITEGDTLSSIAELFGISSEDVDPAEILVNSNRPDIVGVDQILQVGQKIRLPLYNGSIHTVLNLQTMSEIAAQYGVTVEEIMSVSANGISNPNSVGIGDEILIPNPKQFAPAFVAEATPEPTPTEAASAQTEATGPATDTTTDTTPANTATPEVQQSSSGSASSDGGTTGGGASSSTGFIWPVSGPLSSLYGPSHPLGIDIDLFGNHGAPIAAAASGTVTFAGGNPCCSYGYYVVIDHGNGFQTLYAHLSSIGVSVGQSVGQGGFIGNGGTTGYSTGDHLHFEVQKNGAIVNPLNYLP